MSLPIWRVFISSNHVIGTSIEGLLNKRKVNFASLSVSWWSYVWCLCKYNCRKVNLTFIFYCLLKVPTRHAPILCLVYSVPVYYQTSIREISAEWRLLPGTLDKRIKVKNKLISDSLNYLVFHVGLIPAEVENRLAADTAEHRICSLWTEQLVQQ